MDRGWPWFKERVRRFGEIIGIFTPKYYVTIEEEKLNLPTCEPEPPIADEETPFGKPICDRNRSQIQHIKRFYEVGSNKLQTSKPTLMDCLFIPVDGMGWFDWKMKIDFIEITLADATTTLPYKLEVVQGRLKRKWYNNPDEISKIRSKVVGAFLDSTNKRGETIFHLVALGRCELVVVETLLLAGKTNGSDLSQTNRRWESPLHYEALFGTGDGWLVFKSLLDIGNWDINGRNIDGCTPVHFLAYAGKGRALQNLLGDQRYSKLKVDFNAKCNRGWTPLIYAVWSIRKGISNMSLTLKELTSRPDLELNTRESDCNWQKSLLEMAFESLPHWPSSDPIRLDANILNPIVVVLELLAKRDHQLLIQPFSNGIHPFEFVFRLAAEPSNLPLFLPFLKLSGDDQAWDACLRHKALGQRSLLQVCLEEDDFWCGKSRGDALLESYFNNRDGLRPPVVKMDLSKIYNPNEGHSQTILHHIAANGEALIRQRFCKSKSRIICQSSVAIDWLLEEAEIQRVDFRIKDSEGYTALHRAILANRTPLVFRLLRSFGISFELTSKSSPNTHAELSSERSLIRKSPPKLESSSTPSSLFDAPENHIYKRISSLLETQPLRFRIDSPNPYQPERHRTGVTDEKETREAKTVSLALFERYADVPLLEYEELPEGSDSESLRKLTNLQAILRVHHYLETIQNENQNNAEFQNLNFDIEKALYHYTPKLTALHFAILIQDKALVKKLGKLQSDAPSGCFQVDINARWGPLQETPLQLASRIPPVGAAIPGSKRLIDNDNRNTIIYALLWVQRDIHFCSKNVLGETLHGPPPNFDASPPPTESLPPNGPTKEDLWREAIDRLPFLKTSWDGHHNKHAPRALIVCPSGCQKDSDIPRPVVLVEPEKEAPSGKLEREEEGSEGLEENGVEGIGGEDCGTYAYYLR